MISLSIFKVSYIILAHNIPSTVNNIIVRYYSFVDFTKYFSVNKDCDLEDKDIYISDLKDKVTPAPPPSPYLEDKLFLEDEFYVNDCEK